MVSKVVRKFSLIIFLIYSTMFLVAQENSSDWIVLRDNDDLRLLEKTYGLKWGISPDVIISIKKENFFENRVINRDQRRKYRQNPILMRLRFVKGHDFFEEDGKVYGPIWHDIFASSTHKSTHKFEGDEEKSSRIFWWKKGNDRQFYVLSARSSKGHYCIVLKFRNQKLVALYHQFENSGWYKIISPETTVSSSDTPSDEMTSSLSKKVFPVARDFMMERESQLHDIYLKSYFEVYWGDTLEEVEESPVMDFLKLTDRKNVLNNFKIDLREELGQGILQSPGLYENKRITHIFKKGITRQRLYVIFEFRDERLCRIIENEDGVTTILKMPGLKPSQIKDSPPPPPPPPPPPLTPAEEYFQLNLRLQKIEAKNNTRWVTIYDYLDLLPELYGLQWNMSPIDILGSSKFMRSYKKEEKPIEFFIQNYGQYGHDWESIYSSWNTEIYPGHFRKQDETGYWIDYYVFSFKSSGEQRCVVLAFTTNILSAVYQQFHSKNKFKISKATTSVFKTHLEEYQEDIPFLKPLFLEHTSGASLTHYHVRLDSYFLYHLFGFKWGEKISTVALRMSDKKLMKDKQTSLKEVERMYKSSLQNEGISSIRSHIHINKGRGAEIKKIFVNSLNGKTRKFYRIYHRGEEGKVGRKLPRKYHHKNYLLVLEFDDGLLYGIFEYSGIRPTIIYLNEPPSRSIDTEPKAIGNSQQEIKFKLKDANYLISEQKKLITEYEVNNEYYSLAIERLTQKQRTLNKAVSAKEKGLLESRSALVAAKTQIERLQKDLTDKETQPPGPDASLPEPIANTPLSPPEGTEPGKTSLSPQLDKDTSEIPTPPVSGSNPFTDRFILILALALVVFGTLGWLKWSWQRRKEERLIEDQAQREKDEEIERQRQKEHERAIEQRKKIAASLLMLQEKYLPEEKGAVLQWEVFKRKKSKFLVDIKEKTADLGIDSEQHLECLEGLQQKDTFCSFWEEHQLDILERHDARIWADKVEQKIEEAITKALSFWERHRSDSPCLLNEKEIPHAYLASHAVISFPPEKYRDEEPNKGTLRDHLLGLTSNNGLENLVSKDIEKWTMQYNTYQSNPDDYYLSFFVKEQKPMKTLFKIIKIFVENGENWHQKRTWYREFLDGKYEFQKEIDKILRQNKEADDVSLKRFCELLNQHLKGFFKIDKTREESI